MRFGLGLCCSSSDRHSEVIDSNADAKTTKVYAHYAPDATNEAAFVKRRSRHSRHHCSRSPSTQT
jgi:hypothetical protein